MHTVTTVVVVATHHQQHHSIGMFTGVYEFIRIVPCKQIHRCYMYDSSQTIAQPIYIYIYIQIICSETKLSPILRECLWERNGAMFLVCVFWWCLYVCYRYLYTTEQTFAISHPEYVCHCIGWLVACCCLPVRLLALCFGLSLFFCCCCWYFISFGRMLHCVCVCVLMYMCMCAPSHSFGGEWVPNGSAFYIKQFAFSVLRQPSHWMHTHDENGRRSFQWYSFIC